MGEAGSGAQASAGRSGHAACWAPSAGGHGCGKPGASVPPDPFSALPSAPQMGLLLRQEGVGTSPHQREPFPSYRKSTCMHRLVFSQYARLFGSIAAGLWSIKVFVKASPVSWSLWDNCSQKKLLKWSLCLQPGQFRFQRVTIYKWHAAGSHPGLLKPLLHSSPRPNIVFQAFVKRRSHYEVLLLSGS